MFALFLFRLIGFRLGLTLNLFIDIDIVYTSILYKNVWVAAHTHPPCSTISSRSVKVLNISILVPFIISTAVFYKDFQT